MQLGMLLFIYIKHMSMKDFFIHIKLIEFIILLKKCPYAHHRGITAQYWVMTKDIKMVPTAARDQ